MVGAAATLLALVVLGNLWYAASDGAPSPREFRSRVADTGLEADWQRNGGSGGVATIDRACGPLVVDIALRDGELWIAGPSLPEARLDEPLAARIMACES